MAGKNSPGFSLIEVLVGTTIFVLFALGIYGGIVAAEKISYRSRMSNLENAILTEQIESIRNLPYASVGVVGGTPPGTIATSTILSRSGTFFTLTASVKSVDDPSDGQGGSDLDHNTDDYRAVDLAVTCKSCTTPAVAKVSSNIRPNAKNALNIKVLDASGSPLTGASVSIVDAINSSTTNGVTGSDGTLVTKLVNVATGTFRYNITVSKSGFSSDYTSFPSTNNPSPTKLPATVVDGASTDLTFSIDQVSPQLTVRPLDNSGNCGNYAASTNLTLNGSKLIGFPNIYKYSQSFTTNGSSDLSVGGGLEWDNYSVSVSGTGYDLAGSIPPLPVSLWPGMSQNLFLSLSAHTTNSLLVTVKDANTGLPVGGAGIRVYGAGYDSTLTTDSGGGFVGQTDWSGGSGQATFSVANKYATDGTLLEINSPAGDLVLKKSGSNFNASGDLESSTFDLGGNYNIRNIIATPTAQPTLSSPNSVLLQVAASSSSAGPWNYYGPNGTGATFYTPTNTVFFYSGNTYRYVRYRIFLNGNTYYLSTDPNYTPDVSDIYLTYTNGCTPAGQKYFGSLNAQPYNVQVTKAGYTAVSTTLNVAGQSQVTMSIGP